MHIACAVVFVFIVVFGKFSTIVSQCPVPQKLSGYNGFFLSPNHPGAYPSDITCQWHITADKGQAKFIRLDFANFSTETCCDYVDVHDGDGTDDLLIQRIRGYNINPSSSLSTGPTMFISFSTDVDTVSTGFFAKYNADPACRNPEGQTFNGTGNFTSPYFPENYPNSEACTWYLFAEPGQNINVTFDVFHLEPGSTSFCDHDYVEFTEGDDPTNDTTRWCGIRDGETYTSQSHILTVKFIADINVPYKGFSASFEVYGIPTPTTTSRPTTTPRPTTESTTQAHITTDTYYPSTVSTTSSPPMDTQTISTQSPTTPTTTPVPTFDWTAPPYTTGMPQDGSLYVELYLDGVIRTVDGDQLDSYCCTAYREVMKAKADEMIVIVNDHIQSRDLCFGTPQLALSIVEVDILCVNNQALMELFYRMPSYGTHTFFDHERCAVLVTEHLGSHANWYRPILDPQEGCPPVVFDPERFNNRNQTWVCL